MDITQWLIGPLQQGNLDQALLQEWPEATFFEYHNFDKILKDLPDAQGIIILEPLERACPPQVWQTAVPRVAICSRHPQLHTVAAQRVLSDFDSLIAFEDHLIAEQYPELPFSQEVLWDLRQKHFDKPTEAVLFDLLYIVITSWSPQLAEYHQQSLPLHYLIHPHPTWAKFYLRRANTILLDTPKLTSLHFQTLAAERTLLVHPAQKALATYFTPQQEYGVYSALELNQAWNNEPQTLLKPKADPEKIRQYSLRATLQRILQKLKPSGFKTAPLELELYQQAFSNSTEAFLRRKETLNGQSPPNLLLFGWFFLHTLNSNILGESDVQTLWISFDKCLQSLPPGPEKTWLTLRGALQRKHFSELLKLLQQDPWLKPEHMRIPESPGFYPVDPLLDELTAMWDSHHALAIWLEYLQALCLIHLKRFAEALSLLEPLLKEHFSTGILGLWLQLVDAYPELRSQKFMAQIFNEHPLQLALGEMYVTELANTNLEAAQNWCTHYVNLYQFLHSQLLYLERWLTLRARLFAHLHPRDQRLQIFWEGPLCSYSSLSSINRRWIRAISEDPELQVSWLPSDPPEHPMDAEAITWQQYPYRIPDVFVAHHWPPRNLPPAAGHWINILPWEFGVIPEQWATQINRDLDQVWVPSRFVAHSFEISGVAPERLRVIPNGVDTRLLRPVGERYPLPSRKSLRLLFVGGMVFRKGMDLLLQAYAKAFSAADDVVLVIKSFGNSSHYAYQGLERQLQQLQNQPEAPEILLISEDLTPEALASLYRACDVYVHPYRGEGFGMPILEAMACGLPVVIPNAGPAPEFCPPEASWQVYTRLRFEPTRDVQGQGLACLNPYFSEVDVPALARTLQAVAADPDTRRRKAAAAAAAALAYDWQALYPQVKQALQDVSQMPVRRLQPPSAPAPGGPHRLRRIQLALEPLPLRAARSTSRCIWLSSDNQPDLRIGHAPGTDILYLSDSHLPAMAPSQQPIWCSTPAQHKALQAQGQPAHYLPLAVDFAHFSPRAAAARLEESEGRFAFLSILDWRRDGAWQDLLSAYLNTFDENEPVNLVFKPYGADSETMLDALMAWLESEGHDPEAIAGLSFVEEELDYARLPGLYRGCDAFVTAHASGNGIWHLAAQACGLPVLACGHYPFLERPFAEVFAPGDRAHLGWLLRQVYTQRQAEAGDIVRAALQPQHDLTAWLARAEELLPPP